MKKLQKYLVDTLTLSSDTKMTLGKKRLSTTGLHYHYMNYSFYRVNDGRLDITSACN